MKEELDILELSNLLEIRIPEYFQLFNKDIFSGSAEVQLQFSTDFQSGFIFNNNTTQIIVDNFIQKQDFECYWKGRMESDLWMKDDKYLGIANCVNPYGFIVWSVNDKDFGSIHFEYKYQNEGDGLKRIYLEKNLLHFLAKLTPHLFIDRM